jgi:hypothetical protein
MAATTATVMATAKMTTGEDIDNNGRECPCQRARTATTTGEEDDAGKDGNSKDDGDNGKDDRARTVRTTGEDDNNVKDDDRQG